MTGGPCSACSPLLQLASAMIQPALVDTASRPGYLGLIGRLFWVGWLIWYGLTLLRFATVPATATLRRMTPLISTRAEKPEFGSVIWEMPDSWPTFMNHDPVAESLYSVSTAAYPELTVIATDDDGSVIAHGQATAFRLDLDGRRELPDTGWDQVLGWVSADLRKGVEPDVASALEVSVHAGHQGRGLSTLILTAMRDAARARGFDTLLAPVRPSGKHREPAAPMSEYASRTRADGLPEDPWLRIHVRAGGVIEKVAPASMVVGSSLANWREWTGLPFDAAGPVAVPYALTPVHCAPDHDHAVYVEPNVWVRHRL